jgi:hypothetical protein
MSKVGPFELPKIADEYPLYSKLLAEEIRKIESLPNFDNDKAVFIMSDYGGEHAGADFSTYAFLISSADKQAIFKAKTLALRKTFGLNSPFKEIAYKDLRYGPIGRTLDQYLKISDDFIQGVLVTISIDKSIPSMFGEEKKGAQRQITDILAKSHLGNWKSNEAEKLLRVCHPIAMFLALLTRQGQKFLWMSDQDSINSDGKEHNFENTRQVFVRVLRMYTDNEYDIYGFAKPFTHDPFTHDLLSLTDFAAGAIQEVLQNAVKGKPVNVNQGKEQIMRWLGTPSRFLKKVNLFFVKNGETFSVGNVKLTPK